MLLLVREWYRTGDHSSQHAIDEVPAHRVDLLTVGLKERDVIFLDPAKMLLGEPNRRAKLSVVQLRVVGRLSGSAGRDV